MRRKIEKMPLVALQQMQSDIARAKVVARDREVAEVRRLITRMIAERGLRPKDVLPFRRALKLLPPATTPVFRDPKSGKEWHGRGRPPKWLGGDKEREKFRVSAI